MANGLNTETPFSVIVPLIACALSLIAHWFGDFARSILEFLHLASVTATLVLTLVVAGQVLDAEGKPVEQARIYGIIKPEPAETPYSFAETYGPKNHPHPLYGENFAVSDVPPGTYLVGTEIGGHKVFRKVTVEEGKLTWVVFRP